MLLLLPLNKITSDERNQFVSFFLWSKTRGVTQFILSFE